MRGCLPARHETPGRSRSKVASAQSIQFARGLLDLARRELVQPQAARRNQLHRQEDEAWPLARQALDGLEIVRGLQVVAEAIPRTRERVGPHVGGALELEHHVRGETIRPRPPARAGLVAPVNGQLLLTLLQPLRERRLRVRVHRFAHPAQAGDLLRRQPFAPVSFVLAQLTPDGNAAVQREVGSVEGLRLEQESVQRFAQARAFERTSSAARKASQRGAGRIVGLCQIVLKRLAPREHLAGPEGLACVHWTDRDRWSASIARMRCQWDPSQNTRSQRVHTLNLS